MTIGKTLQSFLKVGFIGFGGGSALIPIIEDEIVTRRCAMEQDDYIKHTVIANITPGALPVKLGSTCAYDMSGAISSVAGAYAVAMPGVFLTILILSLFSFFGAQAMSYLSYASVGISVFIVMLLVNYIIRILGRNGTNILLCAGAMLLTFGKEVREIVECALALPEGSLGVAVFDISMIDLMIISLYLIVAVCLTRERPLRCLCVIFSCAYTIASGKLLGDRLEAGAVKAVALLLMLALLTGILLTRKRTEKKTGFIFQKGIAIAIATFIAVPALLFVLLFVLGVLPASALSFIGQTALSTVTSFGGGEAYIAIADSVFVQSGYVASDVFYGQIVPVANALPGPILIKIASAVGFFFGQTATGSITGALALVLLTAFVSIGACCIIALVVLNFYDVLSGSVIILSIKKYILPIICGSLISVSMTMFYESMLVAHDSGLSPTLTALVMAAGVALLLFIHKKFKSHDLLLLVGCIVVSLCIFVRLGRNIF